MAANVPKYGPKGVLFLGVLVEGATPSDIGTKSNLNSWISSLKLPFTYVLDSVAPQIDMETYFNTGRDTYIIVELPSMKILEVIDQSAGGVKKALTVLDELLK